jgi:hypothetical protein
MPTTMPEMVDGTLRFKLRPATGGEATECSVDLMILEMTCHECVQKHDLQVNPETNCYLHTPEFLDDLADRLSGLKSGVPNCTPSMAFQLWIACGHYIDVLKKTTSGTLNSPSGTEESTFSGGVS